MKNVLEYNNFRLYIRDYYAERKDRSGFTWRDFARDAGYSSPVFLKLVCDGKSNLSEVGVERVASAMGLVGVDLQYFRLLVSFNQEKNLDKQKVFFAEMRKLARENSVTLVGEEQYDYFENWLNPVIRELAPASKAPTAAKLAGQCIFDADVPQVKKSLKLLEKTGLLKKNEDGSYEQDAKSISSGDLNVASMAIRQMHRQMGELAVKALDQVPLNERDISGLTMGISESAYQKIVKEIADFRRRITAIAVESAGEQRVYRLNMQLFPLTKTFGQEDDDV
ncbi:TIGR02147 family protein [Fibrobacter sp. UWEL]|uniref:TIGR02147 family protein n=1 Tax=Fibrobacter sp. UWEL TaxID=1896209 RepID=UPI00091452A5|nr:TIGR02147 family protein [Fibrobacter sp. UWEL]SHL12549.1 TIGR02147 family protein [Fibrobacter sp. UWEL]